MADFTPTILRFDSLPSTNVEAARHAAAGASEGFCIVAREQTAGRGRLERQWVSPKDAGLYFSIILRPKFEQTSWGLIPLMAAVAVQKALCAAYQLKTDIKWPNDILANDKKLCGILAETVDNRTVVVGIGINIRKDSLPADIETATSVETVTGRDSEVEVVLPHLVSFLTDCYRKLADASGRVDLIAEWCKRSSYCKGKRVHVAAGCKSFTGTTRGLEPDGALRVQTETGETRIVRAADVSAVRTIG